MRTELAQAGIEVNFVAINSIFAASSQSSLAARGSFDMLQDNESANAWVALGGGKDDFFIYLEGGVLAPGGYLRYGAGVDTNLSTPQGYENLKSRIIAAHGLGPATGCDGPGEGLQLQGNLNQDGAVDLSDAVSLLGVLFLGTTTPLPCGESIDSPGNTDLLDVNGDSDVDIGDPVHLLNYLFTGGVPPSMGPGCAPIEGCPAACPS
jgi:hypothetical protein